MSAPSLSEVLPAATEETVEVAGLIEWYPRIPLHIKPSRLVRVTRMQLVVLNELVQGKSNRQIAAALVLSEDTVKTHLKLVQKRAGTQDRLHLAVLLITRQVRVVLDESQKFYLPEDLSAAVKPVVLPVLHG